MRLPSTNSPAVSLPQAADPDVLGAVVRCELERLLTSPSLRDSDHLKRFLRYIVEHTLAGEGDGLKEYRLGVEVFDRDASFDPKLDPVVRMTARRLRAKLKEHYENGGLGATVRIEVPKGGYAACFVQAPKPECSPERTSAIPRGWRLTLSAGAALMIAALIAGGFYYRSHEQAKRLTDKDTIVLADFANNTGDAIFNDTLKTALSVSLRQSPFLNLLSDQQVAETLKLMTRPADTKLTPGVTRELCQRAGSKAYLAGSIGSLGSKYVLGLKAVDCQSGDTLAQEQVTAASKEKVLDALGQAASKLRRELDESLATVQKFDGPLEQAPEKATSAVQPALASVKVPRPARPRVRRVQVGTNDFDYIGEDVTVRYFTYPPAPQRKPAADGRVANRRMRSG
jgi:hypothetical protein